MWKIVIAIKIGLRNGQLLASFSIFLYLGWIYK